MSDEFHRSRVDSRVDLALGGFMRGGVRWAFSRPALQKKGTIVAVLARCRRSNAPDEKWARVSLLLFFAVGWFL